MNNAIRQDKQVSPVTLRRVYKADFQKAGTETAEVEQVIITKSFYPSKKTENEMNGGLFSAEEFGFEEQQFDSKETRIGWIPVPENTPEAVVKDKLAKAVANGACIYRVLSNAPILTEDQKYAIAQGLRTKDQFANSQAMRYPEDHATDAGKLILDPRGNVQYRRTFFWPTPMADLDDRGNEVYLSPELEAELKGAHVMNGQTV